MAYSELIKDFERIRGYMREFYVYGLKSRGDFDGKSARSYDNERRRIESWLRDYMSFHQDRSGKNIFLSVDSRSIPYNPLCKAFKAKSFTDKDVTLHFYILDILAGGTKLTAREITERLANYLDLFDDAVMPDESTVRNKLMEYENLGLLASEKDGNKTRFYRMENNMDLDEWRDAIAFFSETAPLGVLGSFLLDRFEDIPDYFSSKHRYILHVLDSEISFSLLEAIHDGIKVTLTVKDRQNQVQNHVVFPLRFYFSVQSGRQYVVGWNYGMDKLGFFRLDNILKVAPGECDVRGEQHESHYLRCREHIWGVAMGDHERLEHVEMVIKLSPRERYIVERMKREARCGNVEDIGGGEYRFTADVFDSMEMLPWLRTFIGHIIKLKCSNPAVTARFFSDLEAMLKN